jgi:hypothetical protein
MQVVNCLPAFLKKWDTCIYYFGEGWWNSSFVITEKVSIIWFDSMPPLRAKARDIFVYFPCFAIGSKS